MFWLVCGYLMIVNYDVCFFFVLVKKKKKNGSWEVKVVKFCSVFFLFELGGKVYVVYKDVI